MEGKMTKKLSFVLLAVFCVSFFVLVSLDAARAAESNSSLEEIGNKLRSRCWENAKTKYDEKMANRPDMAIESLDPTQFPEFSQMFGDQTAAMNELQKAMQNLAPTMANETQEFLETIAQINVDLTACYEKE